MASPSTPEPVKGPTESVAMSYDDILKRLGEFGRYQRRIYLLLCISVIPCAFHKLANVFLNAKPDYRCRLPFDDVDVSFYQNDSITNLTRPWDSFSQSRSSCKVIDANFTAEYFESGIAGTDTLDCTEWIFDYSKYKSSAVIEFLLICNREWLKATADALFMFGVLAGSYIFGDFSDRYGRRPTFIVALILQLVGGLATSMAPEYITFVLGRILLGATASGTFLVAYVIALEMVGPTKRLFAGVFVHMFFSLSFLLIALIAYLTMDYSWRLFQVVITVIPGVFLMSYWWIIPESSRWLISRGRHKEAKEIIRAIAKENKVDIPEEALENLMENNTSVKEEPEANGNAKVERQPNILDLFRHKNLRNRSFNIFFSWFVNSISYYGLSWSTSSLGGNDYVNFCLSGIMEFPGYGILLFTLNRYGRKFTLCGALIVCGISLLMTIFVPPELNWLTITFAMIGKMAITSSYGTVYVFTTEQFPTVIRNVALGAASMSARVGGIMAPYINLLSDYWRPLPLIIYGALCLVAGGFCLLLPETLNRTLPETIAEGEAFGKTQPDKIYAADDEAAAEPLKTENSKV